MGCSRKALDYRMLALLVAPGFLVLACSSASVTVAASGPSGGGSNVVSGAGGSGGAVTITIPPAGGAAGGSPSSSSSGGGTMANACSDGSGCPGGICVPLSNGASVCSTPCSGDSDCISGWTCGSMSGQSSNVCQCTPTPEVCDGKDNDCNGIVDDVDANNDGICDCINIATLGVPGTWGQGNVFGAWLAARTPNGATSLGSQVLTHTLIDPFNIIVVQDVYQNGGGRAYSAAEVQVLSEWVNNGGGLMTLTGYANPPVDNVNVNALLAPFGMSYGETQILNRNGAATSVPITQFATHPITAGVTAVGFDNGYEVSGPASPAAGSNFTVYAMGSAAADPAESFRVGEAMQVGKGHVDVWGDEWITYNSEWTSHPDYQVQLFWVNTLKWLTVLGNCQVAIPTILIP